MSKLALNKSSLTKVKKNLESYRRFLPALELKQKQLMIERKRVSELRQDLIKATDEILAVVGKQLPMLSIEAFPLDDLVVVRELSIKQENLVGVLLPVIDSFQVERAPYGKLTRPHWVDHVGQLVEKMVNCRVQGMVLAKREKCLDDAIKTVTQRVNLFSKVLIPQAEKDIHRIVLFLADQERASVVRSKIAKANKVKQVADEFSGLEEGAA